MYVRVYVLLPVERIGVIAADEGFGLGGPGCAVQIGLDGAQELVELRGSGRVQSFVGGGSQAQEVGVGSCYSVEHVTHESAGGL